MPSLNGVTQSGDVVTDGGFSQDDALVANKKT